MYSECDCQTKLVTKEQFRTYYKRNSPDLIIYGPKLSNCDLDLVGTTHYLCMTLHLMVTDHHTSFRYKGSMIQKILRLLSIEMFNLYCDIDLEHSNPVYSLDS